MAITKPPAKPAPKNVDDFIKGAPDAQGAPAPAPAPVAPVKTRKGTMKGSKEQVSMTFRPDILDRADVASKHYGIARAAFVNMAVVEKLEREGF